MSGMAWTLGSARASLFAGISLVARTMVAWLAWLEKNFMTSTARAGLEEVAPSISVLTPTKGDAAFPAEVNFGRVAKPESTPALPQSAADHGPVMIIAAFPSLKSVS